MKPEPSHARHLPPAFLRGRSAERWLRALIVALACFLLLLFLDAAAHRFHYPFELEWIESGMLTSVLRLVHGQGLYVAPTLRFVPYLYAPLYFYVTAALTRLTGLGANSYEALRLVSILSSFAAGATIFVFVYTESRNRLASLAAAGVYFGLYVAAGTFFDIGRVDSLFVLLLLLALFAQRRGYLILAGLLWTLTFQTKQSIAPLAVLVLLAEFPRRRRLLLGLGTFAVTVIASVLLLNHATGGWYVFYVFGVTRALGLLPRQFVLYWPQVVLAPLAIAWVVIAAAVLLTRVRWRSAAGYFYLAVSLALYGGIWFVESHKGASANTAMPIYAWTCVLFGLAAARLLQPGETKPYVLHTAGTSSATGAEPTRVLLLAAIAAQLFVLIYNPGAYIPSSLAYRSGQQLLTELRNLPGDVYVIDHGHDAVLAGKTPFAEGEALGAVIDAHLGDLSTGLRRQFDEALEQGRYSAVVIDDPQPADTSWQADRFYPFAVAAPAIGHRFLTSQPEWFLLRCAPAPALLSTLAEPGIIFQGSCAHATQATAQP